MRRSLTAVALAATLVFLGCPEASEPGPEGPAPVNGGATPPPEGGQDGGAGGEPAADGGEPAGGGAPADAAPWKLIPASAPLVDAEQGGWPMLKPVASWPSPASLKPLSEVPEDQRPDPAQVEILRDLVALLVAEDLRPRDFDAALGVDAQGRTFVKLGRKRTEGSATLESHGKDFPPVFTMAVETGEPAAKDVKGLTALVSDVVSGPVVEELASEEGALVQHPSLKADYPQAANAFLDPSGPIGMQFRYVYAYAADGKVLVVFQEVPHMSLEGDGGR